MSQKKTPILRFKGYSDEWEQRKFNEILDYSISNNTLPRAKLNYDSGQVKNIHYGDILTKFDSVINISEEDVPYITDGIPEDYCKNLLKNGDVIFADTAEDETAGKAIEISGIIDNFVVSGLHTLAARPHIKFASNYLGYYLNSISYHKQLLKFMQGIKVLSISKRNLAKTIIKYPQKITEQEKIGSFFKHIGSLITLHQRKLNILKQLKQAMLQKIFPAKDKKVPVLRFDGFKKEWEQRKLGEHTNLITKGTTPKDKSNQGSVTFVKVENLLDGKIISNSRITIDEHENYLKRSKLNENDILFSIAGTLGRTAVVEKSILPANTNQAVAIIRGYNFDMNFLLTSLNGRVVANYVRKNPTIGAQPNLSLEQVGNLIIWTPQIEEQKKIGEFFKSLEYTTVLHQSKLTKLKSLKTAYLQLMFI